MNIDEILARLKTDPTLGRAVFENHPPALRELFGRCAVPRWFDEPVLAILRADVAGAEGITLAELVSLDEIEPVPGRPGALRVAERRRRALIDERRYPEDVSRGAPLVDATVGSALDEALAAHFAERGESIEALYHLIVFRPHEGMERFTALFDEAARGFDLGRCRDLVLAVREQSDLLTKPALILLDERHAELDARVYFADDYYRSARYFKRVDLHVAFERLLSTKGKWCLRIHGTGGIGKTMFLRWLVARRCVPERIPVARLDFDLLAEAVASWHPWRYLVRLAEQLDEQLAGRPLRAIIQDLVSLAESQDRGADIPAATSGTMIDRLTAALQDSVDGPIVLMLDTYEVPLYRTGERLLAVVQAFAEWRRKLRPEGVKRGPQLKLLLAGRHDLTEKIPGFAQKFPSGVHAVSLDPLKEGEAREYLTQLHEIPDKNELERARVAVVIKRSQGIPLKLALYAHVLRDDPDIPVEELRNSDADMLYLVDRVLSRVPGEVHWILRYGVVPRTLTRAFFDQVMVPRLAKELSGEGAVDHEAKIYRDAQGNQRALPERKAALFPRELPSAAAVNADQLWGEIERYAGGFSWIDRPDPRVHTLVIHPEVRRPMLRLLEGSEIHHDLNVVAFNHARRASDFSGTLYHLLQLGGEEIEVFERVLKVISPTGEALLGSPTPKEMLPAFAELIGPEHRDDDGKSTLPPSVEALVTLRLVEGHMADAADRTPANREQLTAWLGRVDELLPVLPPKVLERVGIAPYVLRVMLRAAEDPEATLSDLEQLRKAALPIADRTLLLRNLARVARHVDTARAAEAYRALADLETALPTYRPERIELADALAADGRLDEAIAELEKTNVNVFARTFRLARLQTLTGQPSRGLPMLDAALLGSTRPAELLTRLRMAEAHLDALCPLEALAACDRAGLLADPQSFDMQAELALVRGRCLAMLGDETAAMELDRGASTAGSLSRPEESCSAILVCGRDALERTGDIRHAKSRLMSAEMIPLPPRHELAIERRLFEIDITGSQQPAEAATLAVQLASSGKQGPSIALGLGPWVSPLLMARVALTWLRYAPASGEAEDLLCAALERIEPAAARIWALRPARHVVSTWRLEKLGKLIARAQDALTSVSGRDGILRQLVLLDARRLYVGTGAAEGFDLAPIADDSLIVPEILSTYDRLGAPPPQWLVQRLETLVRTYGKYPLLVGSWMLDHAERLLRTDPRAARGAWEGGWYGRQAPASALGARARFVRGRIADAEGDKALARAEYDAALVLYRQLGDDRQARLAEEARNAVVPLTPPKVDPWHGVRSDLVAVEVTVSRSDIYRVEDRNTGMTITEPFDGIVSRSESELDTGKLAERLREDWRGWMGRMARALLPAKALHDFVPGGGERPTLMLSCPRIELAAVPWELGLSPAVTNLQGAEFVRGDVTRAQQVRLRYAMLALAEMFEKSFSTEHAGEIIAEFQRKTKLPSTGVFDRATLDRLGAAAHARRAPSILVVRPFLRSELAENLIDPSLIYPHANVSVLEAPTTSQLEERVAKTPYSVVHLVGTLHESPSLGGVYLDVSGRRVDERAHDENVLVPTRLARLLKGLHDQRILPLLVLQLATRRSQSETIRQLLLRNTFTEACFADADVPILGLGLGDRDVQVEVVRRLATGIHAGDSLGAIRRTIVQLAADLAPDLDDLLPTACVTLHCHDPLHRVL